jgi:hypothetical protein
MAKVAFFNPLPRGSARRVVRQTQPEPKNIVFCRFERRNFVIGVRDGLQLARRFVV